MGATGQRRIKLRLRRPPGVPALRHLGQRTLQGLCDIMIGLAAVGIASRCRRIRFIACSGTLTPDWPQRAAVNPEAAQAGLSGSDPMSYGGTRDHEPRSSGVARTHPMRRRA